jgi:hypothetical protein
LQEISLHYVRAFHDESIETISDLLAALPPDVAVDVVASSEDEFAFLRSELAGRGAGLGRKMIFVRSGGSITPWAKDRFGTLETESGRPVLAVPPLRSAEDTPRANDERVPELMAMVLPGLQCRTLPFFFDGGDLLSDRTNVFIAANFLFRNQPLNVERPDYLIQTIESTFHKHAVVLGRTMEETPDHHIGMYLTPLGDNTVAVGDPLLGKELGEFPGNGRSNVDISADDADYSPFLRVAKKLVDSGLRVVRLPLVITRAPRVYITYNNAILETRRGVKRVYMPVYGIPGLDDAARQVYEREGWTVLPVRVAGLYRHTGSLRCLVGIIRRR